jgi:hypothetical protein
MGLLDRIFGRAKNESPSASAIAPAAAERIVQEYGAVLGSAAAPAPGCVADASALPHPKERIKAALVFALRATTDRGMKEQLKIAYISLADW